MTPSPAFPFYPQDFIVGTADMTNEECGVYICLLCYQWCKGSIPDDDQLLSRLTKNAPPAVINAVRLKFRRDSSTGVALLRNVRLEVERQKQIDYRASKVEAGRKGGNKKAFVANQGVALAQLGSCYDSDGSKRLAKPSFSSSSSPSLYKGEMHKDARVILYLLNEACGKHFVESADCLDPISQRLFEEGVNTEGVKQMISRQCQKWKGTPYADGLTPKTLFGPQFHSFYANRDSAIITENASKTAANNSGRNSGTANEGKGHLYRHVERRAPTGISDASRPDSETNAP